MTPSLSAMARTASFIGIKAQKHFTAGSAQKLLAKSFTPWCKTNSPNHWSESKMSFTGIIDGQVKLSIRNAVDNASPCSLAGPWIQTRLENQPEALPAK